MKLGVKHDRDNCIGCGACVSVCPKFWDMGNDGKSDLKGAKNNELELKNDEDLACNEEAAKMCPVNVIHIIKDGKQTL